MKLQDKFLYMAYGAGLVVLGMVLNSLVANANADKGSIDAKFGKITCREIIIEDEKGKWRGSFGLADGDATLQIYGDDRERTIAYLGKDRKNLLAKGEIVFQLNSKSKADKRGASIHIDGYGGKFNCIDDLGENVASISVIGVGMGEIKRSYPPFKIPSYPLMPEIDGKSIIHPDNKYDYK